ncbi:hypothetical protein Gorai_009641 [Gossypium raimondii]|uniref:DUF4283 domain-containing protein n=1 Tax=Gossypium raimondii TaxID=29730 RepID=A0A7J8PU65_GOSRA|nr:hypothetical protein [Gossypium raimondii]
MENVSAKLSIIDMRMNRWKSRIQVHDLPRWLMSKAMAQKLGNFIGSSIQYDTKAIVDEVRDYIIIRVKLEARVLLRRHDEGFCPIRAIEGKKKLVMKSSVFLMAASRRAKGVNESANSMHNVKTNLGINLVGNLVNKESGQMSSMEDFST